MAENPKIALVGPAPPYRSGIAIHTHELQTALEKITAVQTFSFKRQYPEWLYPGNDKNPDVVTNGEPGVRYGIDVYSPLTWRRTADEIAQSGAQVAILTWWTLFWQPGFTYMVHRLQKHGVKTIFYCHNLFDHKTGGLRGKVSGLLFGASKRMLLQADAYIVQSTVQEKELVALKPKAMFMRRMHPIHANPPEATQKLPKRGRLELLFFGLIRPYKGLETLLAAAEQLQDTRLYITVAGEAWKDAAEVRARLETAHIPNLDATLSYISDAEAANYFDRADAVVLPYRAATGSAVVALAYAYNKPVIATAVDGLVDAVVQDQTGWLVAPNDPEKLAKAIAKLDRKTAESMIPGIQKFRTEHSWQTMAQDVADFAKRLTS